MAYYPAEFCHQIHSNSKKFLPYYIKKAPKDLKIFGGFRVSLLSAVSEESRNIQVIAIDGWLLLWRDRFGIR